MVFLITFAGCLYCLEAAVFSIPVAVESRLLVSAFHVIALTNSLVDLRGRKDNGTSHSCGKVLAIIWFCGSRKVRIFRCGG